MDRGRVEVHNRKKQKENQYRAILYGDECDWLPERARWNYLARSELPAVPLKKNFPESRGHLRQSRFSFDRLLES